MRLVSSEKISRPKTKIPAVEKFKQTLVREAEGITGNNTTKNSHEV